MEDLNFVSLSDELRTESDAYRFLEQMRWGDGDEQTCPHCGSVRRHYFLNPENGTSRKTRTGSASQRRVWKCAACRRQFSVLTGTIFHGTKIPVRTWVFVLFDMCSAKNGMSAREIERKYKLTPKTAWYMAHRIREAMKRDPIASLLSGRVVADETFFGGTPSNRHASRRVGGGKGKTDKLNIMALVSRDTGEVRSRVVPNLRADSLRRVLDEHVDKTRTHLHTDKARAYDMIGYDYAAHSMVDHGGGEYVRGDVSTNQAETYFSQLKRSIDGTHHHVSREHLDRYLAEFDYRYTTCKATDTERMARVVKRAAGRRLTYREPAVA